MNNDKIRTGVPFPVTPNPECPEFDMCQFLHLAMSRKEKEDQAKEITDNVRSELKDGTPEFVGTDDEIRALQSNVGIAVSTTTGNWWYWKDTQYLDSGRKYLASVSTNIPRAYLTPDFWEKTTIDINYNEATGNIKITIPNQWIIKTKKEVEGYKLPNDLVYEFKYDEIPTYIYYNDITHNLIRKISVNDVKDNEYYLFSFFMVMASNLVYTDLPDSYLYGVTLKKLDFIPYREGRIKFKHTPIEGNPVGKFTFSIPKWSVIRNSNEQYYEVPSVLTLDFTMTSGSVFNLTFNPTIKEFNCKRAYDGLETNEYILFGFTFYDGNFVPNVPLQFFDLDEKKLDGLSSTQNEVKIIPYFRSKIEISKVGGTPDGSGYGRIKVKIPSDYIIIYDNNEEYKLPQDFIIDQEVINGLRFWVLSFNKDTKEFLLKTNTEWKKANKENLRYVFSIFVGYDGSPIVPTLPFSLYDYKVKQDFNVWTSGDITYGIDITPKINEFTALINDSKKTDSFLFFTDPHFCGSNHDYKKMMVEMQKYYNNGTFNFALSGGDWLNTGDNKEEAKRYLAEIDGYTRTLFKQYYGVAGNHDFNRYGNGRISNEMLTNLWYRKYGKTYFTFDSLNTHYYALDTGTDVDITEYMKTELKWFANSLKTEDKPFSAVALHIWTTANYEDAVKPRTELSQKIADIITAYNNRTTLNVEGESFDFGSCSGKVKFVIGGHTHYDYADNINNSVPVIITTNATAGRVATFDLVYVDYDNDLIDCIRVGDGANRQFSMKTGKQIK